MPKTYGRNDIFGPNEIEWGEPPEPGANKVGVWDERLKPFREAKGKWGKIPGYWPSPVAANIKKGEYLGIAKGEFEATTRTPPMTEKAPEGHVEIWVRYVGTDADPEASPFTTE